MLGKIHDKTFEGSVGIFSVGIIAGITKAVPGGILKKKKNGNMPAAIIGWFPEQIFEQVFEGILEALGKVSTEIL